MRNFLRSPLTWMVFAELVVVATLIAVAWSIVSAGARPALASPVAALPDASSDAAPPLPEVPVVAPGSRGPVPGLNLDSRFWRARLARLNYDQAVFVDVEWRLIHSAMNAMRRYLETVVLPAIQRAERAGGSSVS